MIKSNLFKIFIVVLFFSLFVIGCGDNSTDDISVKGIDSSKYSVKGLKEHNCYRDTDAGDDTEVDIQIKLYSDDEGYLKILKTKEVVTSKNKNILKEYKNAYEKVYSSYKNIEYYENQVEENEDKVISTTYINYGKVDMNKIIEIEGEENNVKITDGKIKLSDWKAFAKKYGTTCEN